MATLVIVDDDPRFRERAVALLGSDGFEVVAEAADGMTGLAAVGAWRPAYVLLDVGLPDLDGFEVARRIAAELPATRVVLTSSREAAAYASRLIGAPVLGFIPKEELSGAAIRALGS
jgi:two-component system, NarL family, nitrate/nitrite response regulator NarL